MSNQTGIYVRLPDSIKAAIQAEVDRLNKEIPGASMTLSSWVRAAIDARLAETKNNT